MICPQTRMECIQRLNCDASGCYKQTAAKPAPINQAPPPPTLAEIERLVDAYKGAMLNFERDNCTHYRNKENEAHAALMAAIRAYGRE